MHPTYSKFVAIIAFAIACSDLSLAFPESPMLKARQNSYDAFICPPADKGGAALKPVSRVKAILIILLTLLDLALPS
jgi:hypothetical protein